MKKTCREIGKKYEWPNMKRDIENYVKNARAAR
jgi:Holliday junction resolvase RusA-like endonuclease